MRKRRAIGAAAVVLVAGCRSKKAPSEQTRAVSPPTAAEATPTADAAPAAESALVTGGGSSAAWFCATFKREGGDPGDRSRCEKSQAACDATAQATDAPMTTPCVAAPSAVCYSSKVEGEQAIVTCYASVADCDTARSQESAHNRQGPELSPCAPAL